MPPAIAATNDRYAMGTNMKTRAFDKETTVPGGPVAGGDGRIARRYEALSTMRCRLLEGLQGEVMQQIVGRSRTRRVVKGQNLTPHGAPAAVHIILAGSVKWTMSCPKGRGEILLEILREGDVFGEADIFGAGAGIEPCQATALEEGELLSMPAADLPALLARYPEIAVRWLEMSSHRLARTRQLVADAMFLDIAGRLYRRLLEICRVDGALSAGERLSHGLSQRELASCIGASRESLNKQLAAWQRDGIVTVGRGFLTVHKPLALSKAASCAAGRGAAAAASSLRL